MQEMYAIIESGGKQYRVEKGDVIDVELLKEEPGAAIEFTNVLLLSSGADPKVGLPFLKTAVVKGQLVEQTKGPKVVSFRYKQRKGIRRKVGHRQKFSRIKITEITE
jgi:large subunit ribosomal protein L21